MSLFFSFSLQYPVHVRKLVVGARQVMQHGVNSRREIEVFGRRYEIPSTAGRLEIARAAIEQAGQAAASGKRQVERIVVRSVSRPRLLGLIPRSPRRVVERTVETEATADEERFRQLERLVTHYDLLVDELRRSQNAYQHFFADLADGVREAAKGEIERVRRLEAERDSLARHALNQNDEGLLHRLVAAGDRLRRAVRTLAEAVVLISAKIDLCARAIDRLANDADAQEAVCQRLRERIAAHRRMQALEENIAALERDIARIARVALEFEQYLEDYVGPVMLLVREMAQMDERLATAAWEIEGLAAALRSESAILPPLPGHEVVLDWLVDRKLAVAEIESVIPGLRAIDGALPRFELKLTDAPKATVSDAIRNVERLVAASLEPLTSRSRLAEVATASRLGVVHRGTTTEQSKATLIELKDANFTLLRISPGTFAMGSAPSDALPPEADDEPRHVVTLTRAYELMTTPVTQALYAALTGKRPSSFSGDELPVESVSWLDAVALANELSRSLGLTPAYKMRSERVYWKRRANGFRLPTEAEWEYAARAGTDGMRYGEPDEIAWYSQSIDAVQRQGHRRSPQPVGTKTPNEWGLYDMLGNVWEWVWDWYGEYPSGPVEDPVGKRPSRLHGRVLRGGAWDGSAPSIRCSARLFARPPERSNSFGFRLARFAPPRLSSID